MLCRGEGNRGSSGSEGLTRDESPLPGPGVGSQEEGNWDASDAQVGPLQMLEESYEEVGYVLTVEATPVAPPNPAWEYPQLVSLDRIRCLSEAFQSATKGLPVEVAAIGLDHVLDIIPPVSLFRAGAPSTVQHHWQDYFQLMGSSPSTHKVLEWMGTGYKPIWVNPHSKPQQLHPKHRENLVVVTQQLQQATGQVRVQQWIDRSTPAKVHFPNRKSALINPAFVSDEVGKALQRGAVRECTREELHVVHGLGVVGDPQVKGRLIMNAMYVNLFVKYTPFHYETLRDIPVLAKEGDCIMVTDFKSGYHHVPLHPSVHKYFGFQHLGRYYCFTVLPFGLASGCAVYTEVVGEVMRPLEAIGLRCLKYIDDIGTFMQQGLVAQLGRALIITVFVFLRLFLSVEKCALSLHTSATLLGLVCNVADQRFIVPQQKARSIIASIEVFIRQGGTKRDLAQLAGKLASISPAVQLAPLFLRRVFQAMGMAGHWEDSLSEPAISLATEDLLYFRQYLESNPGWRWIPRTDVTEYWCAGDASETGYGGHSHLLDQQLILPFSTQDAQRMSTSNLSSTCREIKNICYLVTACIRQDPEKVANTTIVCYSDNQGAVANVNNLRGSPEEVTAIRDMWVWASQQDVQIRVEWRPRTTDLIRRADALSRIRDQSD